GSGMVRDLNEAISLSPELGDLVANYAQQTTRSGQVGLLNELMDKWVVTSDMKSLKEQADALASSGVTLTYYLEGLTIGTPEYNEFLRKLGVVERFMGFTYRGFGMNLTSLDANSGSMTVDLDSDQIANILLAYDRFQTDIYESLLLRTRLQPYVMALAQGISFADNVLSMNGSAFEDKIKDAISANPVNGIIDLIEFMSAFSKNKLADFGDWNADAFLIEQLRNLPDLGEGYSQQLNRWTVYLASATEHKLTGSTGADFLVGNSGNDVINDSEGNNLLVGGAGNDRITGSGTFHGGAGDDVLTAGSLSSSDTYLFNIGDGKDSITDVGYSNTSDKLVFGAGIVAANVRLSKIGNDLVFKISESD
ncbi:MAG: hypothetical protein K2P98_00960, partial [Neisseriaceae bacterium]|nr:hypothetical protein [Neisseriaceae bacterium]